MTFYGGKKGYDYICFDGNGQIRASGKRNKMLAIARKMNWAVGKLYPIRYAKSKE